MKLWRIVLLPLLALVLTSGAAVPAAAQSAPPVKRKALVSLHKQGGFAGFDDRVTVYTNGCVRLSRRTGPTVDKCLTKTEFRKLRAHLKRLRLGRSERPPQGADFLKYTLSYRGHKVVRYQLPKTWRPVVSGMETFMTKYWAPD
ncbi:hypothetical protein HII36_47610 [Nonomuraea sp. NN258]|uniref:hypothetical protein n=1 Tax=Nonomuraea antri TaxID=2730852 RepID=UPI001567FD08|nr:hypothetical protein [Nonomuraea antri]NRQ39444.1 hypothetical protein [Nonomuraea antri]